MPQRAPQDHKQHQHACAELVLNSLGLRKKEQSWLLSMLPFSWHLGCLQAPTNIPHIKTRQHGQQTGCSPRRYRLLRQALCKQAL